MKGLAYIDDLNWIKDFIGLSRELNIELDIFTHSRSIAEKATDSFKKIYYIDIEYFNPDSILNGLRIFGEGYDLYITSTTQKGRIVSGYIAGLFGYNVYSDVTKIDLNKNYVERLVYGGLGKAIINVELPLILSLVKGVYHGEISGINGNIETIKVDTRVKSTFKVRELLGVDPTKADVVIGAGRGFKNREDLSMVEELAKLLGGAWSVTRPLAADYGWCNHWIGISGLNISPKIYLIIGSSGQPHHMLGARSSKFIIAVNKDPDAPIFQECDYGIVGDLYKVVPQLIKKIKEIKGL